MKKLLLFIAAIAAAVSLQAQGFQTYDWFTGSKKPAIIPSAPALSSPVTIVQSNNFTTGIFWNFTYGAANPAAAPVDVLLSGTFPDCISQSNVVGTSVNKYRFRNLDGTTVIGATTAFAHGVSHIADNNYQEYYGLSPAAPLLVRTAPTGSGGAQNGFQLGSRAGGSTFKIQNAVVLESGASGFTANFGGGGANYYERIDLQFLRCFNAGQEGIYIGNTSTGFHVINNVYIRHYLSYNTIREGLQVGHCGNVDIAKCTIKLSGQGNVAGQNNTVQVHDSNGIIEGCIFDDAPVLWNIFTHGFTFRNCTFIFNAKGFIGDATTAYFAPSARVNGQAVLFDRCNFIYIGAATTVLTDIAEPTANYEFRNCKFTSNITAIFNDIRVGATNSLIGTISTNGNTTATLTRPTYTNFTASDYTGHGIVKDAFYRNLKQGYRASN